MISFGSIKILKCYQKHGFSSDSVHAPVEIQRISVVLIASDVLALMKSMYLPEIKKLNEKC